MGDSGVLRIPVQHGGQVAAADRAAAAALDCMKTTSYASFSFIKMR